MNNLLNVNNLYLINVKNKYIKHFGSSSDLNNNYIIWQCCDKSLNLPLPSNHMFHILSQACSLFTLVSLVTKYTNIYGN